MVGAAWNEFAGELGRWRDSGRAVEFWWRDDDAGRPDPALARLYALASRTNVPLALAAVPEYAEPAAFEGIQSEVAVMQHGVDHRNRAGATEKKTEFSATEPVDAALRRLLSGRAILESVAGARAIAVLAPPWNRISPGLLAHLSAAGYRGVTAFGVRNITNPGVAPFRVNTHVDIIDWRGSRGFCGVEQALGQATGHLAARRLGEADPTEPTGWLTHHAVHDEAAWGFLENLFEATRTIAGITWRSPASLFGKEPGY